MSSEYLSKEHEVLVTMRKVLSKIIRDVTPSAGRPHPLRENTIEDIKHTLMLISSREKEIHEEHGKSMDARPRYPDQEKTSQVVDFVKPDKKN